jgi:hypothetical protein
MDAVFYLPDALRLFREVARGDPGDHLRDRHAGAARAGHQRPPGEPRPAGAAGEVFSARQLICIIYAGFNRIKPGAFLPVPHKSL